MLSYLAQPECHRLQRIQGVDMSTKQVSCSSEPNRFVRILIVCKAVLWSPALSSVWEPWSSIPWPDWTRYSCWLYLFLKYLFLSKGQMTLLPLFGFASEIFHCANWQKEKNQVPCAHTDSSKSKGSHVLVVLPFVRYEKFQCCILWNAFLHHASSMLHSLPPSCFQL